MNDIPLREAVEVLGRVAKQEIAERDERIADLKDLLAATERELETAKAEADLLRDLAAERTEAIGRLEQELDEAGARIEDLMPKVDASGTLVRED